MFKDLAVAYICRPPADGSSFDFISFGAIALRCSDHTLDSYIWSKPPDEYGRFPLRWGTRSYNPCTFAVKQYYALYLPL